MCSRTTGNYRSQSTGSSSNSSLAECSRGSSLWDSFSEIVDKYNSDGEADDPPPTKTRKKVSPKATVQDEDLQSGLRVAIDCLRSTSQLMANRSPETEDTLFAQSIATSVLGLLGSSDPRHKARIKIRVLESLETITNDFVYTLDK